jgi:hypothetical protein
MPTSWCCPRRMIGLLGREKGRNRVPSAQLNDPRNSVERSAQHTRRPALNSASRRAHALHFSRGRRLRTEQARDPGSEGRADPLGNRVDLTTMAHMSKGEMVRALRLWVDDYGEELSPVGPHVRECKCAKEYGSLGDEG